MFIRQAFAVIAASMITVASQAHAFDLQPGEIVGEVLDPGSIGESYIETMADAVARDRAAGQAASAADDARQGVWSVPSRGATFETASGDHYVTNKWGDARMGIGFGRPVDVIGAFFAGQADPIVWAEGVRVFGYRDGDLVARSAWFCGLTAAPTWFDLQLKGVDRIEILALPGEGGGSWYALDDLTFAVANAAHPTAYVVDFDDLNYRSDLTDSGYAGLDWEIGAGEILVDAAIHSPIAPLSPQPTEEIPAPAPAARNLGTPPTVVQTMQGVIRGDAGSMSYPPDTDGAIGPNHYVETVNRMFAVYDKATGAELTNIQLGTFLPGSNGDPRVLFDADSQRWFIIVSTFDSGARIHLAVSLTSDPMGGWLKTNFLTAQDADTGCWPDYPTLGVDRIGVYIGSYMVGCGMSVFAISKAPLVSATPALTSVTAFRGLPFEGALQPAHSFDALSAAYIVSVNSSTSLRLRRLRYRSGWSLLDLGTVSVPAYGPPPNAPALGSTTALNTVGDRLMMAAYRDGSLWTCHTIGVSGRAACRWYEIDVASTTLVQSGTVSDPILNYFFPSIMVNRYGSAVMGFSGSSSTQYAGCYVTGRLATDPPGQMAPPQQFKAGTGVQNNIDSYGRNRWGDYSYTTLDPADDATFWTIQQYGHASNIWGTYIAAVTFNEADCNTNGILDDADISGGASLDCNADAIPDECSDLAGGDFDADGDLDVADYSALATCLSGPGHNPAPPVPACAAACLAAFDHDGDGDVDLEDAAHFLSGLTNP